MNNMPEKKTGKAPVKNAAAKKPETKITKKAAPAKPAENSLRSKFSKANFKLRKQRFKYGSLATVMSLLIVTAVILVNVLIGVATDKYGLKFDMTSEKRFELNDQTIEVLEALEEDITFHVFCSFPHSHRYDDTLNPIILSHVSLNQYNFYFGRTRHLLICASPR